MYRQGKQWQKSAGAVATAPVVHAVDEPVTIILRESRPDEKEK